MIEQQIEQSFIKKLVGLKYAYRQDITDRTTLGQNLREKFDALKRVRLTDSVNVAVYGIFSSLSPILWRQCLHN